jgi:hypothetical protein
MADQPHILDAFQILDVDLLSLDKFKYNPRIAVIELRK